jgi:protein ImuB
MNQRYLYIWFRFLETDWLKLRHPELRTSAFVFAGADHGRIIVKSADTIARSKGIKQGMVLADARAILPGLKVYDEIIQLQNKLLNALAEWCIRYTPSSAVDLPDGLILDISGCAHLWGGEQAYLKTIVTNLSSRGYHVRAAIADTIGTAWAIARYGKITPIIDKGDQSEALLPLPPAALRLQPETLQRLEKLGLKEISSFINMPRTALRRRFGQEILLRLDQALGHESEFMQPVQPTVMYQERLPCLEPIKTATGIEIALKRLLETICHRFSREQKGLRKAIFKCYRTDGKIEQIDIGTSRASRNMDHLFRLFELKINLLEPDLGFDLFVLEAPIVEELTASQEALWSNSEHDLMQIAELLDKIGSKIGNHAIQRYLPAEHYWPERSIKSTFILDEKPATAWRTDLLRPIHLLTHPIPIRVMVLLPDYPPMQFSYKGNLHKVVKADGPERVEQEWWLNTGEYRDYYCVENESGARYWIFRLGDYNNKKPEWFIHGFFA